VPSRLALRQPEAEYTLAFRSDGVYRNVRVCAYLDGEKIHSAKKRIVTPGEMETLSLRIPGGSQVEVRLEPLEGAKP
jgi:hypothetical protein